MKILQSLLTIALVGILLSSAGFAQLDRDLDIVIVYGAECSKFLDQPISNLRVYTYDASADVWSPIPYQVDEFRIRNGTLDQVEVAWNGNGKLTGVDEIVFMAKDMGDVAPNLETWPDDVMSQGYDRYEIIATNPETMENGYAYIYYSETLATDETFYVTYNNDRIYGETYGIAHHSEVASGLPDSLAINGNDVDVLDSWRIRAKIDKIVVEADLGTGSKLPFTGTNIYFSEDMDTSFRLTYGFISVTVNARAYHEEDSLRVKAGNIRVLREHTMAIELVTTGLEELALIPILTKYYGNFVEFEPAFSLDLGDDVTELETDHVAFSQGFNENSMQVKFYGNDFVNSTGQEDSLVNRNPENLIFKDELFSQDWPGLHWWGFSGQASSTVNNATFFTIAELNGERIAPGRAPALYYYDFKNDDEDPAPVYGIAGLRIYDWDKTPEQQTFEIDARYRSYYFAQNSTRAELQGLFDKYSEEMLVSALQQKYPDNIPPGRIADLRIIARTDTTATLAWTAPADDGYEGAPASYYVIRQSVIAPQNPDGDDWTWWGAISTVTAQGAKPVPAEPGELQTMVVTDLNEATIYYFRMNVVDDAGNVSGLSNTASMSTTPVELASFTATLEDNRRVHLQWTTESETNNLGFRIERRFAEQEVWEQVGFVNGNGTTIDRKFYTFADQPQSAGEWFYRLKQIDTNGASEYSEPISIVVGIPQEFMLSQNYPNPFNPETTISFTVPENATGQMVLVIYDMLGRKVRTLFEREASPGYYDVQWNGRDDAGAITSSGVYIYQLRAGDFVSTKKMIKLQ